MLQVNVSEVPNYVELGWKSGANVLLVGDPGCGKTTTIMGMQDENTKVTMFTGSSTYEESVNGIPFHEVGDELQKNTVPKWFKEMHEWANSDPNHRNILFIDEFNTAAKSVLDTFLLILSDHKVPTLGELPENTVIVAAMNPQSQNGGEDLQRPQVSRFLTLQIKVGMNEFRGFLEGTPSRVNPVKLSDNKKELTLDQKLAFLDQISPADWGRFEDGMYHEINARSMTNFFTACEYVDDLVKEAPKLSEAFLGVVLQCQETVERLAERRRERIKSMKSYPTQEELEDMSNEELEQYAESLKQQTNMQATVCRARCLGIIKAREKATE